MSGKLYRKSAIVDTPFRVRWIFSVLVRLSARLKAQTSGPLINGVMVGNGVIQVAPCTTNHLCCGSNFHHIHQEIFPNMNPRSAISRSPLSDSARRKILGNWLPPTHCTPADLVSRSSLCGIEPNNTSPCRAQAALVTVYVPISCKWLTAPNLVDGISQTGVICNQVDGPIAILNQWREKFKYPKSRIACQQQPGVKIWTG